MTKMTGPQKLPGDMEPGERCEHGASRYWCEILHVLHTHREHRKSCCDGLDGLHHEDCLNDR